MKRNISTLGRLQEKYVVNDETGCWEWIAARDRDGYGKFSLHGRQLAHRVSYELHVGPITSGLTLDHLCRNRACVNPAHLEPVSHRENVLRGEGVAARNARKTYCDRGHEFTPENTYERPQGGRRCLACKQLTAGPAVRAGGPYDWKSEGFVA